MMGNILILSAGRRVSLVKSFITEAAAIDRSIRIYTADADPALSSACRVSAASFKVPRAGDELYHAALKDILINNNIKIVIPTIDTELLTLAEKRDEYEADGIYIMVPPVSFTATCRDKRKTHAFLLQHGVDVAKEMDREQITYPLFAKPVDGSSSNQIYLIPDESHLPPFLLSDSRFMLLEYLDKKEHDEYTCDAYANREGEFCCIVPRKRIETRAGEVSKGITEKNFLINIIREKIGNVEGGRGCITFQLFVHRRSQKVTGIEINPRFGGGYPLSYQAGANFPHWIIMEYLFNEKVKWYDRWEDNLLMLRYDEEIIVHGFNTQR